MEEEHPLQCSVCACVCVCVCASVCACVCVCVCVCVGGGGGVCVRFRCVLCEMCVWKCMYVWFNLHWCLYLSATAVHIHVCMHLYIYLLLLLYVDVKACMYEHAMRQFMWNDIFQFILILRHSNLVCNVIPIFTTNQKITNWKASFVYIIELPISVTASGP